jgi:hypothetical protein
MTWKSYFWPLCCLSFDWRILVTSLASSTSSSFWWWGLLFTRPLLVRLLAHLIQMCYVNECVLFISWRLLFVSLTFQTLICTIAEPKLGKIVHGKKRLRFVQMKVILAVEGHKIRKITVTGWRVALFGQMVWLIVN